MLILTGKISGIYLTEFSKLHKIIIKFQSRIDVFLLMILSLSNIELHQTILDLPILRNFDWSKNFALFKNFILRGR